MVIGKYNEDSCIKFKMVNQTGGNKLKLFPEYVYCNLRKCFFSNRVIQIWNSLPHSEALGCRKYGIDSFKINLDKLWQNVDVKFNWKANPTGAGSRNLSLL